MAHLSEAALSQINQIIDKYIDEPSPLMMILSAIQKDFGYIPLEVQEIVSQRTGLSVAEIYGVVTFYSFFSFLSCSFIHIVFQDNSSGSNQNS